MTPPTPTPSAPSAHDPARQTPASQLTRKEPTMNDQYETDFNRWLDSLSPGQREQITRDIEAAEERIARQEQP